MNNAGVVSLSENEMSEELRTAKEEMEKLRGEVESSRSHMLQYKSIAQVNETALKQMDSAHENFRLEGEKKERLMEAEIVSLREKVLELQNEIASLREESVVKISQMEAMNTQMSTLKNNLEKEHEKWRDAQRHYERQVILQSETIQELTNTSQALAALQEEASELRKLAAARETENVTSTHTKLPAIIAAKIG
ncbi:unnamed protein product [Arabidopsis lyrata]|nr:unnamed protein product [Arabidopsis lyrata]